MRRRSFTLIELLVVVAIIAILAGILLPVLNSVRQRIKGVSCLSNIRQIAVATATYLSDNNRSFMVGQNFPFMIDRYMGHAKQNQPTQYKDCAKMICGDSINESKPKEPYNGSYGWVSEAYKGFQSSHVINPQRKVVILDSPVINMWHYSHNTGASRYIPEGETDYAKGNDASYIPGTGTALKMTASQITNALKQKDFMKGRHAYTINLNYVDGHAESLPPDIVSPAYHRVAAQLAPGYGPDPLLDGNMFSPKNP